jgi:hypothetical protein
MSKTTNNMNSNGYTSADAPVPKTGQHWDPAGEYEFHDTVYTLTVYVPPRPPPKYLPAFLTREPLHVSHHHIIRPDDSTPNYDDFERRDLEDMGTKIVKVKSHRFPAELRCKHVRDSKVCNRGCYVLEKGGKVRRWRCKREDCEGHVYNGNVKKTEAGWACFGKSKERLVCYEGLPG